MCVYMLNTFENGSERDNLCRLHKILCDQFSPTTQAKQARAETCENCSDRQISLSHQPVERFFSLPRDSIMSPVLKRQPKIDDADFEAELSAITMAPLNNQQSPQQPGNNNNGDAKVPMRERPKPLNLKSTTDNGVYATASASPSPPILLADDHQELECIEDPLCSARTAQHITFQDVTTASFRIKGGIEYTPCQVSIRFVRFRMIMFDCEFIILCYGR